MAYETIEFSRAAAVGRIHLNCPEAGNALSPKLLDETFDAVQQCEQDPAVGAVLLTAAGPRFCVGGDLKVMSEMGDEAGAMVARMAGRFHSVMSAFLRMGKPVVAAVNGVAAGGGFSLSLCGDIVLAAASAQFTLAYTGVGLSPDGGSTYLLPRLVGLKRARELMLTNRVLGAEEALAIGLIDRVAADGELAAEATAQAVSLARGPRTAMAAVKRLLASTFQESLESQMELEARAISGQVTSPDAREGMQAFFQKRKPDFPA